jgi:esterase
MDVDCCTSEVLAHLFTLSILLQHDQRAVALLRPERVEGLVVLDIAPVTYTVDEPHWQAVTKIIQTMADKHPAPSTSDADRVFLSKREMDAHLRSKGVGDPNVRAFCLTNYQEGSGWKIPVDTLHSQLPTLAGFDDFATLAQQWRGDAFFVHGGQSKFVRSSHLSTIADFFPRHMLTTIRGAGHWVHAEAPEDVTALLQQYLERHR